MNKYSFIGLLENILKEGRNDPGIFKAIFLGGGPGSGKSTVANEIFGIPRKMSFAPTGLKVFNSDKEFEYMLKKAGYSADLRDLNDDEDWEIYSSKNPESIYSRAKIKAAKRYKNYLDGRLGMIIDITARNRKRVDGLKKQLDKMGYDTYMTFVNTTLDKALERNKLRERKLKEELVISMWHEVQNNLEYFKQIFGKNFIEIKNNKDLKAGKIQLPDDVYKAMNKWAREQIKNPISKEWIDNAKKYNVKIGISK